MADLFKKLRSARQSLGTDADRRTRLGNVLALLFITAGFVLIGLAWNGAASQNFIQRQFPYLISGGVMGLGLILTGMLLALTSALRAERRALTRQYDEVITLLGRNLARLAAARGGPGADVVAAGSSYHRPGCRVLEGKSGAVAVSLEQAAAEGLARCRVCEPPPGDAGDPASRAGETAEGSAGAEGAGRVPSEAARDRAQVAATAGDGAPLAAAPEDAGAPEAAPGTATETLPEAAATEPEAAESAGGASEATGRPVP